MKTCPICEKSWPSNHANCPTDGAMLIDLREQEPGTVIRGKYRIVRMLGRGGMGTVYLAEHILLNRPRALKFISAELSQDAAFLRRFRHEAQAAIELRHPNIAEVVDLDQAEDGSPYIAMEYVEGPDLRHALESGAFPVERALAIVRGIARGLGTAHAKGIIHRDVKPENVLLAGGEGKPETPKLLDFGIAAMKESATVASRTHGLLLTPPYAAPEQWKGMATEELDGRADLYALGGVLYEMLTGKTPFHAHNTEGWMYQHLHEQPQLPSQLRPELANWQGLDALVLRLLAKDREQRPRDVAEMAGLLDAVLHKAYTPHPHFTHPETVIEPPTLLPELPQPIPTPSRPVISKWTLAAIFIVIALGAWATLLFFQSKLPASGKGTQTAAQPASVTTPTATKPSKSTTIAPATIPGGGAQAEAVIWTDPATSLMWAKKDNGKDVNWQQATDYCRNLQLAGHSDWRLPEIKELKGIYEPGADIGGMHVKGNLQLTGWQWSSSRGNASDQAWYFFFSDRERGSDKLTYSYGKRALCVRRTTGEGDNKAANLKVSNPGHVKRTIISYGVAQGLLIQSTPPVYPPIAKAAGVSGMVELKIIISKTGTVDDVRVVSGHAMLQQAAIDAVKQWRYQPYVLDGKPVEVETMVNVAFTL